MMVDWLAPLSTYKSILTGSELQRRRLKRMADERTLQHSYNELNSTDHTTTWTSWESLDIKQALECGDTGNYIAGHLNRRSCFATRHITCSMTDPDYWPIITTWIAVHCRLLKTDWNKTWVIQGNVDATDRKTTSAHLWSVCKRTLIVVETL